MEMSDRVTAYWDDDVDPALFRRAEVAAVVSALVPGEVVVLDGAGGTWLHPWHAKRLDGWAKRVAPHLTAAVSALE
jgi:hypothetical protein